jgi:hypothetical protein
MNMKNPPQLNYGVRSGSNRWFYATFRYWLDALNYAKGRRAGVDRDRVVVIVRLRPMRQDRKPSGKLLRAGVVVWTDGPKVSA